MKSDIEIIAGFFISGMLRDYSIGIQRKTALEEILPLNNLPEQHSSTAHSQILYCLIPKMVDYTLFEFCHLLDNAAVDEDEFAPTWFYNGQHHLLEEIGEWEMAGWYVPVDGIAGWLHLYSSKRYMTVLDNRMEHLDRDEADNFGYTQAKADAILYDAIAPRRCHKFGQLLVEEVRDVVISLCDDYNEGKGINKKMANHVE
jgi:hypothetical protein